MLSGSNDGAMGKLGRPVSTLNEQPEYPASFVQFKGDRPMMGDARSPLGIAVQGGGLISPPDFPATPTVDYPRVPEMAFGPEPWGQRPPPPPEPPKPPQEPPGPIPLRYGTIQWTRRSFRRRSASYGPLTRRGGFSRFRSARRMPHSSDGRRVLPGGAGTAFYG